MRKTPQQEGQHWADLFMKDGDMSRKEIMDFFTKQAKAGRKNASRTNYVNTARRNTEQAEAYEYALKIMGLSTYKKWTVVTIIG